MNAADTGSLIALARKEKGLTQGDLAQSLHVSVQAVSKWERGLNFPDITLLEPLGELLDLTVSQLMSGQRDTVPQEELVRDSLRLGSTQLGGRVKKWRRLFLAAAGTLVALVLSFAFFWVRNNTDWLPQKETVISPVEIGELDAMAARVAGNYALSSFDITFADGLDSYAFRLELWDETGLVSSADAMLADTAGGPYPRHAQASFAFSVREGAFTWHLTCSGTYTNSSSHYDCLGPQERGEEFFYGWSFLDTNTTLDPAAGAVLAAIGVDGGHGIRPPSAGNYERPELAQGQSVILLRLVCT